MALRRLREKEAVNYMELHCGKPIAFGKRERKAEVLSELFEVERIIANLFLWIWRPFSKFQN
jgi:hypothetical protein